MATVKELRVIAKEANITGWYRMNKAELESVLFPASKNGFNNEQIAAQAADDQWNYLREQFGSQAAPTEEEASAVQEIPDDMTTVPGDHYTADEDIDIKRVSHEEPAQNTQASFHKFVLGYQIADSKRCLSNIEKMNRNMTFAPTAGQVRLLNSLEDNYKITVNRDNLKYMVDYSQKIDQIIDAVQRNKVSLRPDWEERVAKRANEVMPVNTTSASQIKYITDLCNKIGFCVEMPKSKEDASSLIRSLENDVLRKAIADNKHKVAEQKAVAPAPEKKFSFLDAVNMYFKRLFA
jgi:hypothetical protein